MIFGNLHEIYFVILYSKIFARNKNAYYLCIMKIAQCNVINMEGRRLKTRMISIKRRLTKMKKVWRGFFRFREKGGVNHTFSGCYD